MDHTDQRGLQTGHLRPADPDEPHAGSGQLCNPVNLELVCGVLEHDDERDACGCQGPEVLCGRRRPDVGRVGLAEREELKADLAGGPGWAGLGSGARL